MKEGQIECLHCGVPYFPKWNNHRMVCEDAARSGNSPTIGEVWATTCPSCGEPVVEFAVAEGTFATPTDRSTVFPVPVETAIEIVVNIFLDYEVARRDQDGEEPLSDEEKDGRKNKLRELLIGMWGFGKNVHTGQVLDWIKLAKEALPFFQPD